MAYSDYSPRFFFRFESQAGREFRIDIKKYGYTGAVEQRPLGRTPVLKREHGDNGIYGTSLEIYAECHTDGEFAELYTSSAREFLVELSEVAATTTVIWRGFITPELYAEPEVAPPYDVQIIATDGFGELKLYDFVTQGRVSLYAHLSSILAFSGLTVSQSNIIVVNSLACTTPSISADSLLTGTYVDLDHLAGESAYDVLERILASLHMCITRFADKWVLYRESDIAVSGGSIAAKTAAGVSVTLPAVAYGSMTQTQWYPVGRIDTDIEPAKNAISVAYPFEMRESMFTNPNLPSGTGWTYPVQTVDNNNHYVEWMHVGGGEMRPILYNVLDKGAVSIYQDINVVQYDGNLLLRLLTMQFGNYKKGYTVYFSLKLTGTETYWLKLHNNGYCTWETSEEENSYDGELLSGYTASTQIPVSAFNSHEFGIPGLPVSGTLRITITSKYKGFISSDPGYFYLGGVFLTQTTVPGFKDNIVIDNDARGSAGDVDIAFGDAPYVPNATMNIRNILTGSNITATSEWATSRFSGEFLSVIAMDYALGVSLPRLRARGTLNVPATGSIPFAIVNPDGIAMLIQTMDWKIVTDDLEIEALSLPAAAMEIVSSTVSEMTPQEAESHGGLSGGSGGSSSSSSSFLSGPKLFEEIDNLEGDIIGAKALYDLYIIQSTGSGSGSGSGSGDGEVLKDVSDILRHLSLRVITPQDADPYTVLVSDITIASEKNVVAGGVGDGSGGTGGGSLASLADVTLTSPQVGDTLVFDSTNHWVNVPLNLNALADVDVGTPAPGQALLWNATLGKWIPGTVQGSGGGGTGSISVVGLTMPTGFTVTGSPLTTDGTIAVTMATGYAIPTTDYLSLFSFNKSGNTITTIKPNYSMILGTSQLPLSLSVFGGASVKSLVCSTATQTSENSVGTAASPWYAIYGTTLYEGGQSLANKYQAKLPSGTTNGQVLTWNGSAWVAGNGGGSGEVNVIESISVNGTTQTVDSNKNVNITVPTTLAQLSADATHRLVTDTEKSTWNAKQAALPNGTTNGQVLTWNSGAWVAGNAGSGGEVNIINSISVNGTNVAPDADKNVNIVVPAAQIQSDWNQTSTTAKDYIKNKPTIPTVGAGVLTIKMNGSSKGTFSANATAAVEIDLGTVVTSLSGYATESWVTNKGYITSAALSGYATETWVTNKGYLTAHQSLGLFAGQASGTSNYETSDPYIILTGGGTNKGAVRLKGAGSVTVSSDANGVVTITGSGSGPGTIPAADANTLGGIKLGFTSASRNFGVAVDENNRAYVSVPDTSVSVPSTVPTIGTSDTTLATVGGTAIKAKIASYLLASDFTAANIVSTLGTTAVNRATADASGNTITSAYLRKNTDDTMAGNLAIGTSSSSKKLTIYGTTSAALTIYGSGSTYSTNIYRDSSALQVSGAVSLGGATSIGGNTSIAGTLTVGSTSSAKTATFCGSAGSTTPAVTIKGGSTSSNSVDLYIASGVLNITKAIKVAGNISATGNVVAGVSSDRRLKKDIRSITLTEAADLLSVLNPVVFHWNEKAAELGELHGVARGFLADEYLALLPNAGRKIWGEYDAIDYNQVIPYLVAGWQQQNLRIRILEDEIAVLKEENQRLNRRMRDVV